jgi:short-subunit dehydrogenase
MWPRAIEGASLADRPYAFITGASSGIGAGFARLAAAKGCDIGITARRTERLDSLAGELRSKHNIAAEAFPADLSAPGSVRQLIDAVRAAGSDAGMFQQWA